MTLKRAPETLVSKHFKTYKAPSPKVFRRLEKRQGVD